MESEDSLSHSQKPATGPYPGQMHPVHTFPPHFPKTHSNFIFHLPLGLPSGLFPSGLHFQNWFFAWFQLGPHFCKNEAWRTRLQVYTTFVLHTCSRDGRDKRCVDGL